MPSPPANVRPRTIDSGTPSSAAPRTIASPEFGDSGPSTEPMPSAPSESIALSPR